MKPNILVVPVAIFATISLNGCSTMPVQTAYGEMPQYCTTNNTAAGAVVGTILGAAIGAAVGGGRGAAIGAASGLALGGVAGAQADAQCRQIAMQRVMEMAAARDAAARQAAQTQPGQPLQVAYDAVDYVTPSDKRVHRVTPLYSQTDPATRETCRSLQEINYDEAGKPNVGNTTRVCAGPDGKITRMG